MSDSDFVKRLRSIDVNFIIGVAGDSGSGKTTFTNEIRHIFGEELVSTITLDDYHTEDRAMRKVSGRLPLDPEVNKLDLAAQHLGELKKGKPIVKPVYDHGTGAFGKDVLFEPTKIVIVEGLHPFYTDELRSNIDFGIYVDPDREVKWAWKVRRDVEKRGHSKETVEKEIMRREPLYKRFIDHQKIYAQVVVKIHRSRFHDDAVAVELIQEVVDTPLHEIDLSLDLTGMLNASEREFMWEFRRDFYYGKPVARITLDGEMAHDVYCGLEKSVQDFTGLHHERCENDVAYKDSTGLAQLLLCWRFLEKMDFILRDLERR
jgi:phosphoribulokinase